MNSIPAKSFSLSVTTTQPLASAVDATIMLEAAAGTAYGFPSHAAPQISRTSLDERLRPANKLRGAANHLKRTSRIPIAGLF